MAACYYLPGASTVLMVRKEEHFSGRGDKDVPLESQYKGAQYSVGPFLKLFGQPWLCLDLSFYDLRRQSEAVSVT